jgi:predicted ATP-binding protein involved in virulence
MNYFIKNIHVNKLFHLNDFDIPIADKKYPHLIITGKNGSGKTVLLNAISDFLNTIKSDLSMDFLSYNNNLSYWREKTEAIGDQERMQANRLVKHFSQQIDALYGKVELQSDLLSRIIEKYNTGNFIISFYQADRKVKMSEPKNPTKPVYNKKGNVKETVTSQFLNFLSDLKIQEALARNESLTKDADEIKNWFNDFEDLLRQIYQDKELQLEFNYRDYSFKISTEGKKFKFTDLSDGFAAILDIVADLILKMQEEKSLTRSYQKEGIVLIDEIETHLHLGLQKVIMPLLTKVFPNIQFIITTHSPFVLSSMPNAVAYDLEHKEILDDLTEYSYEALAEGYFGVKTQSSYAEMQLERFKELLAKEALSDADKVELKQLKSYFEKINEVVSPLIVGEFHQVVIKNVEKLNSLKK